jgi:phytoene dehydrogenase-like protein
MSELDANVIIVGAGLSGLCCARSLHRAGVSSLVLEAADRVGGRVTSDVIDGFTLDRGFQVFLTAYPEAQRVLDYEALDLRKFFPGSLVRLENDFHLLADPWRKPIDGLRSVISPILPFGDIVRIARLRWMTRSDATRPTWSEDLTAGEFLRRMKFSDRAMDRFFRPFFGGVFLERELTTSAAMLAFVFAMFSSGYAAIPATGMRAIPEQIAANLLDGTVRTGASVDAVAPGSVTLGSGETLRAERIVLATDGDTTRSFGYPVAPRHWHATTTLYFAAEDAPISEPILVLNGRSDDGPVNHLCVPSNVAPTYAPAGGSLISISIIGVPDATDADVRRDVLEQMSMWFGPAVRRWRHLDTCRIPCALPAISNGAERDDKRYRLGEGIYACGDYLETPSIDGAMRSGRLAAEAILADVGRAAVQTGEQS